MPSPVENSRLVFGSVVEALKYTEQLVGDTQRIPRHRLLFRGEHKLYERLTPSLYRLSAPEQTQAVAEHRLQVRQCVLPRPASGRSERNRAGQVVSFVSRPPSPASGVVSTLRLADALA
jgi:hypothetical protein